MTRISAFCAVLLMGILAGCAGTPPQAPVATVVSGERLEESEPVVASAEAVRVPSEAQLMAAVDEENNVFFVLGSSSVNAAGRMTARRHAERLKANPKLEVTLVGYTDDLGSPSYNLAIAELRVNAIHKVLRAQGVRLNQIRRHMAGREELAPACRSTACRKKMRRVEFVYDN